MPIRLLSDNVSSMIAAGEVIERPASVVKELLENALDAGATEISVDIRGGGVEQIRIADNGCGIPSDELELAFQRFATSKITDANDLDAITTLGFRGEALPSIASVSRMLVTTHAESEDSGTRLQVREGEIVDKRQYGASLGTVMTVQQLFRNVPARRKFLRTTATETSHIQSLVSRYALAYPEVAFRLNTGRSSISTPGSGSLQEAVAAVYSLSVASEMLTVEPDGDAIGGVSVEGMISQPSLDRANRGYISFFVNRRWVQSRMLGFALEQAYHGFLKERRFPIAVLNISLPYDAVDVNAHPTKAEVRFRNGDRVFSAIQQAVRHTLTTHSPVHPLQRGRGDPANTGTAYPGVPGNGHRSSAFWPAKPFDRQPPFTQQGERPDETLRSADVGNTPLTPKQTLPMLRVLGQVQQTYIVAEGPDGLYLIDQHAAHERVMFERIKADAAANHPQSQTLMEPLTIELDPHRQEILEAHQAMFAELGLLIEPFGGSVYLIRGVPNILADTDPAAALADMLDELAQSRTAESWFDRAAYSLACHAAIRAGKTLSADEMTALTRQLEQCEQPHTCPHGRPTIIHMSSSHLETEFGRR